MKKAVIYSRVSSDEQLKGLSPKVQKDNCKKWATDNNYQVVGVFEDGGKSGTKTVGRDGLEEMILFCHEEKVDAVLIVDTDRIARNEVDHFFIKNELKKSNTKLIAINQPMINDTPEGQFFETILAGTNAFYSRLLGRKVRKSLEKKIKDGNWPGWAPLGYINVNRGSEEKPDRVIEIDPDKGHFITELFSLYATGGYSADELVDIMNKKGLRSKNNKPIYRNVIYTVIKNPFYIGVMLYKNSVSNGRHPSLTTKAIFDTCQEIMNRNNHNACRRRKYKWLLNGYVYCAECNTRLFGDQNSKKGKAYYHGNLRQGCSHYIPLGDLEMTVAKQLKKIELSQEFVALIIEKAKELIAQSRANRDGEILTIRNSINQLENKRRVLEDRLLDQTIDNETFRRLHDEIDVDIQNQENEIANIENQRGFDLEVVEEVLKLTDNLYETYLKANFVAKRHYLGIFFEKLWIKDKKVVRIDYTPLFAKLIEANKVRVSYNWLPG